MNHVYKGWISKNDYDTVKNQIITKSLMAAYSFIFFLIVFIIVGVLSFVKAEANSKDYLLAGSNMPPWLVALSAQATNNSGYMFVGMTGFTWQYGLVSIWLMVGWIFGDFIASLRVHQRLRAKTTQKNALSYATLLARWQETEYPWVRLIGGLFTLIFLGTYAAAQFKAGSKALYVLFGWNYATGAVIGSVIVLAYCLAGGIRASIWTDAAQSFVMLFAMSILAIGGVASFGGIDPFISQLNQVSEHYMNWFSPEIYQVGGLGPFLFIAGWIFAGLGVIGQPHVMIRFMTMSSSKDMTRVRWYYYSWYIVFYALTIMVGLLARLMLPELGTQDLELALPQLAIKLFPEILVGLTLAGLFAATMSTADSQVLSCTAAISQDFGLNRFQSYWLNKGITFLVTAIALIIALTGHDNVFQLVLVSWSALASVFAPLLIIYCFQQKPSQLVAVLMMLTGFVSMLLWRFSPWSAAIYDILPGMLGGFIPWVLARLYQACSLYLPLRTSS